MGVDDIFLLPLTQLASPRKALAQYTALHMCVAAISHAENIAGIMQSSQISRMKSIAIDIS